MSHTSWSLVGFLDLRSIKVSNDWVLIKEKVGTEERRWREDWDNKAVQIQRDMKPVESPETRPCICEVRSEGVIFQHRYLHSPQVSKTIPYQFTIMSNQLCSKLSWNPFLQGSMWDMSTLCLHIWSLSNLISIWKRQPSLLMALEPQSSADWLKILDCSSAPGLTFSTPLWSQSCVSWWLVQIYGSIMNTICKLPFSI